MTPRRHGEICRLIIAARDAGLTFLPEFAQADDGKFHVEFRASLWDVADWMPGSADFHASPSPARLRVACLALARLHCIWGQGGLEVKRCPAVVRRINAAREWLEVTRPRLSNWLNAAGPKPECALQALAIVNRRAADVLRLLEPWRMMLPVQPCLCDIWHDHLLFTGNDLTGLIDFGAVKHDNVAVDLARMLGSLVEDNAELYAEGLEVYQSVRQLTGWEVRLVPLLDRTGIVIGLANWLRRLFLQEEEIYDRAAAERRMAVLVRRAEKWDDDWL
jgi:Ser/Thr protein kinase RdoA (MazF antagonist)